jgi:hypothetical protein
MAILLVDGIEVFGGNNQALSSIGVSSGGGFVSNGVATTNAPLQNFDLSVLGGLRDSDKYLGRNRVSDIKEAYQTYISGNPIGRGGQYAVDAASRYGTDIREAARGYLVTVGLPTLANIISPTNPTPVDTTKPPDTTVKEKNPFEVLADILPGLFGNAVYNPPLQSQTYGYTPTTTETPLTQSGGSSIGIIVILGVVGVIGYFLYKRFAK